MRRYLFSLLVLAIPIAGAKAGEKIYRLGDLEPSAASAEVTRSTVLPELAKLGFRDGANLIVDERIGDGAVMPRLGREVLRSRPDAIIAFGADAILAVREAGRNVPIVTFGPDLVQLGLAASFTHPGGNLTGVVVLPAELDAKRLERIWVALNREC